MNKKLFILFLLILSSVFVSAQEVTREEAAKAILDSQEKINLLEMNNFSVVHFYDLLLEANKTLQQVDYAEILRNLNSTQTEKSEARQALRLISWSGLNYSSVLMYTEEIFHLEEQAYTIQDRIKILKGINLTANPKEILSSAENAFNEERYNDANNLLDTLTKRIEEERVDYSTFNGLSNGIKNFFERYLLSIITTILILSILTFIIIKISKSKRLTKKIKEMKLEKEILSSLIKKTQEERFNDNKISALVYNLRMKTFQNRIEKISEELPVLELKLKKKSRRFK